MAQIDAGLSSLEDTQSTDLNGAVNSFPADFGATVFQQALDLWINPELERRKEAGTLPSDFQLQIAQIVMNVDKPVEVRLNGQVRATMKVRVVKPVNKGDPVFSNDFDEVQSIELTDHDPNAAHLTVFNHNGNWVLFFDFYYNTQRIKEHLKAAKEFLETAEDCLAKKRYRTFHENLFAATELCAKSWLLSMPMPELLTSRKHSLIQTRINSQSKLGNIQSKHAKVFNQLSESRAFARYLNGEFNPSDDKCQEQIAAAKELFDSIEQRSPKFSLTEINGSLRTGLLV